MLRTVDLVMAGRRCRSSGSTSGHLGYLTAVEPRRPRGRARRLPGRRLPGRGADDPRRVGHRRRADGPVPGRAPPSTRPCCETVPRPHRARRATSIDGEPFVTYAADGCSWPRRPARPPTTCRPGARSSRPALGPSCSPRSRPTCSSTAPWCSTPTEDPTGGARTSAGRCWWSTASRSPPSARATPCECRRASTPPGWSPSAPRLPPILRAKFHLADR